ncbi:hypothetical protein ACWEQL_21370 [Kitasatospora sp. NPDC004240]
MMSDQDLTDVVRRLTAEPVEPGWSGQELRDLVGRLGWTWEAEEPDGRARVTTGLAGGDAVAVPVGATARTWAPGQEYLELVVPVSHPDAGERAQDGDQARNGDRAQAEAFRRIADTVRRVLGEATYAGSHGLRGPAGLRLDPSWGKAFLRWRRGAVTLELRAGEAGPELVLQPSRVWESWYAQAGRGYVATLEGGQPLEHPRWESPGTWDDLENTIGAFLRTLPAVSLATGLTHSMPLYGRLPGRGAPLLFDIACVDHLYVSYTEYLADESAAGANAAALGWSPRESLPPGHLPPAFDGEAPWRVDAGGPGQVDASEVAALIVRTARAAGLDTPTGLIVGGEAEYRHPYRIHFTALALPVG